MGPAQVLFYMSNSRAGDAAGTCQVGEKWLLTYSYRGIVIANAARRSRRRLPHFHPLRLRPSIAKREKGTVSLVLGFRFRWIPRF
ncbi:hypothetical protein GW17_00020094 [Ensete ventricosum]|nr:hypothetical protein GW17_00020094 [Ensete ventricosum]